MFAIDLAALLLSDLLVKESSFIASFVSEILISESLTSELFVNESTICELFVRELLINESFVNEALPLELLTNDAGALAELIPPVTFSFSSSVKIFLSVITSAYM